jgi:hypothetical protein
MKQILTPSFKFGPYHVIETLEDCYMCDGAILPFTVVGTGEVMEWDGVIEQPPVQPVVEKRHITQLAFINRFTDAEAIAIDLASQGTTVQAAAMRRYQAKVNAATYIDLDRQDTRDGVIALEALGLLGTGRALSILDDPILFDEQSAK